MSLILFSILFFIFQSINRNCSNDEETPVFSQCKNNLMTAIYYWNYDNQCDNQNHDPIFNISCLHDCPAGQFLSINKTDQVDCLDCPENTYSTGKSLRFSDLDQNFDQIRDHFEIHCKWYNETGNLMKDTGCTSWHPTSNNTLLQIGDYNGSSEIIYELYLHPKLIENGSITFKYQTNFPKSVNGSEVDFIVGIDGSIMLLDELIQDKKWHIKSMPLFKGYHEIYWGVFLHNHIANPSDLIKINLIEIKGIHNP